jgi:hypothetical protein
MQEERSLNDRLSSFDFDYKKKKEAEKTEDDTDDQKETNITCVLIMEEKNQNSDVINHLFSLINWVIHLIIDSEITDHAICNKDLLTDYVEINSLIKTESDQKLSIVEKEK